MLSSGKEKKGMERKSWKAAVFETRAILGCVRFEFCQASLEKATPNTPFEKHDFPLPSQW